MIYIFIFVPSPWNRVCILHLQNISIQTCRCSVWPGPVILDIPALEHQLVSLGLPSRTMSYRLVLSPCDPFLKLESYCLESKKWYQWIYLQNRNRITDVENKLMVTRGDCCCSSVAKSCLTLWPHGLQHTRLPCPSLSPRVCSNSCPLSRWCHPTISSSAAPFSIYPQSFPASGSFSMSRLFTSVAKVLELQHQSFQWIFRVDFL